jgi:hypothetical protein
VTIEARIDRGEAWLAGRVGIETLNQGLTKRESRREHIRTEIRAGGLANLEAGKRADGRTETYASAFERLFSEPL